MWKNIVERDRPQMKIWFIRIAYWIPKATNTHSKCVILTAVPLHQRLHERASLLRYTFIDCLVLLRLRIKGWAEHAETEDKSVPFNYFFYSNSCTLLHTL